jgi:hypothetical protein
MRIRRPEPMTPVKIPDELRRLANLTLIEKFEDLDKRLRAASENKDAENRAKIEALLVRLAPIDRDLRQKIDVFRGLVSEWRALDAETGKARATFAELESDLTAKVKSGAISYSGKLDALALSRSQFEQTRRDIETKAAPLLKTIRDLDDEIKALQLVWSELELEIIAAAGEAQLSYFRGVERRLQEFRPVAFGGRTFALAQGVKSRRRECGNYKRNSVVWGLSMRVKAADIPALILDSRIPDKYLGRVKEIIAEAAGQGRDINLNVAADGYPAPGISWSFVS